VKGSRSTRVGFIPVLATIAILGQPRRVGMLFALITWRACHIQNCWRSESMLEYGSRMQDNDHPFLMGRAGGCPRIAIRLLCSRSVYSRTSYPAFITQQYYGELCRSPRNDTLLTPSGLEGSSGSSGFVCRGVAGAVHRPLRLRCRDSRLILTRIFHKLCLISLVS